MIIVSGEIEVAAESRDGAISAVTELSLQMREASSCLSYSLHTRIGSASSRSGTVQIHLQRIPKPSACRNSA